MSLSNQIDIQIETINNNIIVLPVGDIRMNNSSILRKTIGEMIVDGSNTILMDLSQVPYMDSSGLAVLIEALKNCREKKITFLLCNLSSRVRGIIEIAHLNNVFTIFENREIALNSNKEIKR
jgi:anti-sigma B factor antagonist